MRSLMERITNPAWDDRTQFVVYTARAIYLRNKLMTSSDEACIVRALCACELWGLNQFFTLAPRSIGMMRADIAEVLSLMRKGLL